VLKELTYEVTLTGVRLDTTSKSAGRYINIMNLYVIYNYYNIYLWVWNINRKEYSFSRKLFSTTELKTFYDFMLFMIIINKYVLV